MIYCKYSLCCSSWTQTEILVSTCTSQTDAITAVCKDTQTMDLPAILSCDVYVQTGDFFIPQVKVTDPGSFLV